MISKLLTKLNTNPNFDITSVTEDNEDYGLYLECQFLQSVKDGVIKATVKEDCIYVNFPDAKNLLVISKAQGDSFMFDMSDAVSYEVATEECCGITAFITCEEVVAVLPTEIIDKIKN